MKIEARFPLDYPVMLRPLKGKKSESAPILGKSFNLSRGGLGIRMPEPRQMKRMKRDQEWLLTVSYSDHRGNTEHEPIEMRVRVVWLDGQNCGLAIVEMAASHRKRFEHLISGFETLLEARIPQLKAA
jgi:hypothetical protein